MLARTVVHYYAVFVCVWVSRVIRIYLVCIHCYVKLYWLKKLAPLCRPIRSITWTNRDLLAHVFRATRLHVAASRFDWLTVLCDITLVLVLRYLIENRSKHYRTYSGEFLIRFCFLPCGWAREYIYSYYVRCYVEGNTTGPISDQ